MTTSGLNAFNLDLSELVEEAFERCGSELRSGYDLRTARRSLNILTIEWSNRGINLWTIEQGSFPLVTGQIAYTIPTDTIDLLDQVIRTGSGSNQVDINITRISESTYATIPTKNAQGRPIQVWINRQSGNTNAALTTYLNVSISATDTTITVDSTANLPSQGYIKIDNEVILYQNVSGNQLLNCFRGQSNTIPAAHLATAGIYQTFLPNVNIWPTPNAPGNQYTFVYWRLRRLQDGGNGVTTQDIPFRFIPCLVAGLAYYLSIKLPNMDMNRVVGLKADYEQQFQLAADEDREKAAIRFVPRTLFY
tara:strand:- start:348 stop:1268 length:921 start_codon:yes stop_codon:yes gene_type:complete